MNASYDWLKAFVPFDATPAELRALITAHVATVDELIALRGDLASFVVARVVEEGPHPDSDHLHVTKVDDGSGTLLDVVCGAPNVTAGKLYPFARTGTVMPDGLKIQKRKIRGAISDGMLCSSRELGLGDDQEGILELQLDVPPGTPLLEAMPLGDTQLVIDVGANRPDLLSHLGIAREIAAVTSRTLSLPSIGQLDAQIPNPISAHTAAAAGPVEVRIAEPGLVRRFMGVVVRGVTVGPSPEWLVQRLQSVGSRSINNVVDASNYVLHELGQPTHAFDLAKLEGAVIVVRRARSDERIVTLDGVQRALGAEMIVIADAARPQAIGGVMGGRDSEVTDATTDVFVEVANFDPTRIRNARRALGMSTDASYRFERGVDIDLAPRALERVVQLIISLAGGSVDGAPVDLARAPEPPTRIDLRPARVARVLGESLSSEEIASYLDRIGFGVERAGENLRATVPTWRGDVKAEVDLIEEIARLRGYDSFPVDVRPFRPGSVPDDPQWLTARRVREALVGAGMLEARPMPFVAGGEAFVRLANPLSENEAFLRREILDTLSRRTEYNLARMHGNVRLFEIGSVFEPRPAGLPYEEMRVAAVVMGRRTPPHFTDPKSTEFDAWIRFDEWDAKGMAELAARAAYPGAVILLEPAADKGALWSVIVDGRSVGLVRPLSLDAPVWAAPAYGFEISLGEVSSSQIALPGASAYRAPDRPPAVIARYEPLPTTPAAEFDLALLVPESVTAAQVEDLMRRVSGRLLERVDLFDRYLGRGVEPGYRSLAWRLTFRHGERTLREREIEARRSDLLKALADELNVRQRTI